MDALKLLLPQWLACNAVSPPAAATAAASRRCCYLLRRCWLSRRLAVAAALLLGFELFELLLLELQLPDCPLSGT